jgi:hypothetical protein
MGSGALPQLPAPSATRAARWRQTFENARRRPSPPRIVRIGSPATVRVT